MEYQNFKITKDVEKASILMMQYRKTSREYNNKFNRNHKIFIEREVNRKNRSQFFNERTRTSEKRTRTNKKTAKNILVQTQISPNNQKYSYDIMLTVKEI